MGFGPVRRPATASTVHQPARRPRPNAWETNRAQRVLWQDATCAAPPAHLRAHASTARAQRKPSRRQHAYGQDRAHAVCGASSPRAHGEHHVQHQVLGRDAQQWLSALASWKAAYSASGSRRWAACSLASSMASFMARLEWGTAATRLSAAPFRDFKRVLHGCVLEKCVSCAAALGAPSTRQRRHVSR